MATTFDKLIEAAKNAAAMRTQSEQGFPEASRKLLHGTGEFLVPTTPEDIGLTMALGPFGKAVKAGGLALAGLGYSPEAEAGIGALMSLFSKFNPEIGAALDEAEAFGKTFPGSSADGQGDAARHAYAAARVGALRSPEYAKRMGALYEMMSLGADRRSSAMDEHNNAVGAMLSQYPPEVQQAMIRRLLQQAEGDVPKLQWSNRPYEAGY